MKQRVYPLTVGVARLVNAVFLDFSQHKTI